jgi:hypothetical protein|tara:strand:- start:338 stop:523 length:186 start_codon:yes stop_codon:yes gene_type:complete
MYVNPEDDKVKQLHSDIGRTLPKENLKLGQKMKSGGKAKKYGYMGGGKVYDQPRKANYTAG